MIKILTRKQLINLSKVINFSNLSIEDAEMVLNLINIYDKAAVLLMNREINHGDQELRRVLECQ